jgi:hypothetical protein
MKRTLCSRHLSLLVGVGMAFLAIVLLAQGFAADKAPPKPPVPPAKATAMTLDRPKYFIEMPAKRLLAKRTNAATLPSAEQFVNPKVEPGKVRWHKNFADACAAAKKSGKPVLLFQMMGKLDERFC